MAPLFLVGVCGSAHIYLHSASEASTIKKVPHNFIPPVLIQSSTPTFGGFPRQRFVKAKSSLMSLNPSPLILRHLVQLSSKGYRITKIILFDLAGWIGTIIAV